MHMISHTSPQREMDGEYITRRVEQMYGPLNLPRGYFDYVDNDVFVSLSEREDRELFALTGRVDTIMRQAYIYAYEERYSTLQSFYPWLAQMRREYPYDEHFIARYDAIYDRDGAIKFIENNANTPGMQLESAYFADWLTPLGYTSHASRIRSGIIDFWKRQKDQR